MTGIFGSLYQNTPSFFGNTNLFGLPQWPTPPTYGAGQQNTNGTGGALGGGGTGLPFGQPPGATQQQQQQQQTNPFAAAQFAQRFLQNQNDPGGSGVTSSGMGQEWNGTLGDWVKNTLTNGPISSFAKLGEPMLKSITDPLLQYFRGPAQGDLNLGPSLGNGTDMFGWGNREAYGSDVTNVGGLPGPDRDGMMVPEAGPTPSYGQHGFTADDLQREVDEQNALDAGGGVSGNDWSGSDFNSGNDGMGGFYAKGGVVKAGLPGTGNPPGPDDAVIAATKGEGVLRAEVMKQPGAARLLKMLNSGQLRPAQVLRMKSGRK